MGKTAKIAIGVGVGILTAVGAVVLADRYLGHNYLGTKTGKVVGRCYKNDEFLLYVKRFGRIHEVSVERDVFAVVQLGDYFDMASDGVHCYACRRVSPEEVLTTEFDDGEFEEAFGDDFHECTCAGYCCEHDVEAERDAFEE